MREAGIPPADGRIIADGKRHRYRVEGDKPGSLNGEYALHLDGRPAGFFRSYKAGIRQTWKSGSDSLPHLSDDEREALAEQVAERQRQAEADRIERHERAAANAAAKAAQYGPAPDDHPYLVRKGVKAHGAALTPWNELFLPLRDIDGKVWSFQTIDETGAKLFLAGARKAGTFYLIGDIGAELVIAEGFATAASIREATGLPVVVALDAGNLLPVADALRQRHPAARIVIAADDDHATAGNPGLTKATAAADAVGAVVAVPVFADEATRGTDFNDLAGVEGLEVVAGIVRSVLELSPEHAPPPPPAPEMAAAEAAAALWAAIDSAFGRVLEASITPVQIGIKAAAGLGKTRAVQEALRARPGIRARIYTPTVALADEWAANYEGAVVIRGRGREVDGKPLCRKADVADMMAKARIPVAPNLCRGVFDGQVEQCEHFDSCAWIQQFRRKANVHVLAHEHLWLHEQRQLAECILPKPDVVVIDESFWAGGARQLDLDAGRLTAANAFEAAGDGIPSAAVGRKLRDALEDGRDPRDDLTVEEVALAVAAESATVDRLAAPVTPAMRHADQRRRLDGLAHSEALSRWRIYKVLLEEMNTGRPLQRIRLIRDLEGAEGELRDVIRCHWRRAPILPKGIPIIYLDASLDAEIARLFLPHLEVVEIAARRNAEVLQVSTTTCSRAKLMSYPSAADTDKARAANRLTDVRAMAEREVAAGRKVALITYKPVRECLGAVPGVDVLHFGNLRGLDHLKNHDTLILAGRHQVKPAAAEGQALSLWGDSVTLDLSGEFVKRHRAYRMKDGTAPTVEADEHADERVNRVLYQLREEESVQAIDRLRLIHRTKPARIIILSNLPLPELTVDRLTTWSDLAPDRFERTAIRLGGCMPLSAAELHRLAPGLWSSVKAAEHALARRVSPQTPKESSFLGFGGKPPPTAAKYRHSGAAGGGRHATVLLPVPVASCDEAEVLLRAAGFGDVRVVEVVDLRPIHTSAEAEAQKFNARREMSQAGNGQAPVDPEIADAPRPRPPVPPMPSGGLSTVEGDHRIEPAVAGIPQTWQLAVPLPRVEHYVTSGGHCIITRPSPVTPPPSPAACFVEIGDGRRPPDRVWMPGTPADIAAIAEQLPRATFRVLRQHGATLH